MQVIYPFFAEYNVRISNWLQAVSTLPRLEADETVPVIYTSPRRAFAMGSTSEGGPGSAEAPLVAPPSQGNNFRPLVTFQLTGATLKTEKIAPFEHVLTSQIKDNNDNVVSFKLTKLLQVWEISYTANMYTALQQDADILLYKFATEFRPQCHLWIGDEDHQGEGQYGKWANLILDGITDASDYEPGDIGERVIRKDLSWRITEAYLPLIESGSSEDIVLDFAKDLYYHEPPQELIDE